MAKHELRIKARELRKEGKSVRQIATTLGISKGTASIWVRDIILSIEQLERLRKAAIKGGELGRLLGALMQKKRRLDMIEEERARGIAKLSSLTEREFLIAGIALYWGEGGKKSQQIDFCNSDPKMIKFFIGWLSYCFGVRVDELRCRVGINELHRAREITVKQFWSELTEVPLNQFNQTLFKKTANKKVYDNFNEHYGTLTVRVLKPSRYFFQILGQIEGLNEAGMKLVFRDVS